MKTAHRIQSRAKRQHRGDPSAIYRLMGRMQAIPEQERTQLEIPVRLAFEAMRNGSATTQDYVTLGDAINLTIARSYEIANVPECIDVCKRAMGAMIRVRDRYQRMQRWGFDGPGLQEVSEAIDLYSQVLSVSSPMDMYEAGILVNNTIRKGCFFVGGDNHGKT